MAKRIGLAGRYTSIRKEVEGRVYGFRDDFKEGVPIEHIGPPLAAEHKGQVWDLLDYFDNGYAVMQGDKEIIHWMLDLWNEDSERLNIQGRVKKIVSNGKQIFLFLLDPSGKKRLHDFGIKPVPNGLISITVKISNGGVQFDLWVPASERMKINFVNNILKGLNSKKEAEF